MEHGGTVVTGKDSKLTLNTSIGQAISLGMGRPADGLTHLDRWGGYGTGDASVEMERVVLPLENMQAQFHWS